MNPHNLKGHCFSLLLILVAFPVPPGAQIAPQKAPKVNAQGGCRESVQNYYDWYSSLTPKRSESRFNLAIKLKPEVFQPSLLTIAKRDSEAQAKATSEDGIVGLDFDPFLFDSDPKEHFKVREVRQTGSHCLATVYGEASGEIAAPELTFVGQRWRFINVHYRDKGKSWDLLGELKSWESERQSARKH